MDKKIQVTISGDASKLNSAAKSASVSIGGLKSAIIGLGAVGAIAGLTAHIKRLAEKADEVQKLADRLGVTSSELQGLERFARQADMSFESLKAAVGGMSKTLGDLTGLTNDQKKAFDDLGLSASELQKLPVSERWMRINKALAAVTDSAKREKLAFTVLGKGAKESLDLIAMGAVKLERTWKQSVAALKVDEESMRSFADLNESIREAGALAEAISFETMGPAVAVVVEEFQRMRRVFEDMRERGVFKEWAQDLKAIAVVAVSAFKTMTAYFSGKSLWRSLLDIMVLRQILKVAGSIISAEMKKAFSASVPALASAAKSKVAAAVTPLAAAPVSLTASAISKANPSADVKELARQRFLASERRADFARRMDEARQSRAAVAASRSAAMLGTSAPAAPAVPYAPTLASQARLNRLAERFASSPAAYADNMRMAMAKSGTAFSRFVASSRTGIANMGAALAGIFTNPLMWAMAIYAVRQYVQALKERVIQMEQELKEERISIWKETDEERAANHEKAIGKIISQEAQLDEEISKHAETIKKNTDELEKAAEHVAKLRSNFEAAASKAKELRYESRKANDEVAEAEKTLAEVRKRNNRMQADAIRKNADALIRGISGGENAFEEFDTLATDVLERMAQGSAEAWAIAQRQGQEKGVASEHAAAAKRVMKGEGPMVDPRILARNLQGYAADALKARRIKESAEAQSKSIEGPDTSRQDSDAEMKKAESGLADARKRAREKASEAEKAADDARKLGSAYMDARNKMDSLLESIDMLGASSPELAKSLDKVRQAMGTATESIAIDAKEFEATIANVAKSIADASGKMAQAELAKMAEEDKKAAESAKYKGGESKAFAERMKSGIAQEAMREFGIKPEEVRTMEQLSGIIDDYIKVSGKKQKSEEARQEYEKKYEKKGLKGAIVSATGGDVGRIMKGQARKKTEEAEAEYQQASTAAAMKHKKALRKDAEKAGEAEPGINDIWKRKDLTTSEKAALQKEFEATPKEEKEKRREIASRKPEGKKSSPLPSEPEMSARTIQEKSSPETPTPIEMPIEPAMKSSPLPSEPEMSARTSSPVAPASPMPSEPDEGGYVPPMYVGASDKRPTAQGSPANRPGNKSPANTPGYRSPANYKPADIGGKPIGKAEISLPPTVDATVDMGKTNELLGEISKTLKSTMVVNVYGGAR